MRREIGDGNRRFFGALPKEKPPALAQPFSFSEALRRVAGWPPLSIDGYCPKSLSAELAAARGLGPTTWQRGSLFPAERDPRRLRTR
jgi:hypothetical protein